MTKHKRPKPTSLREMKGMGGVALGGEDILLALVPVWLLLIALLLKSK